MNEITQCLGMLQCNTWT